MKHSVEIRNRQLLIDGRPCQILSGAIHYFRSFPARWDDLFDKAKAMGLDAIETYIAWNEHEKTPGKFDYSGRLDFELFFRKIQEHGLLAIVRPGPYICAEWYNGGLPVWLTAKTGTDIRRDSPVYMKAVENWFNELLPRLSKLQYTNGGNIIMTAVENEYGSYGCDKVYLGKLRDMFLRHGWNTPLITADGGGDPGYIRSGMIDDLPVTMTMGPWRCMDCNQAMLKIQPDNFSFCMEYWCGWFDHWGFKHRDADIEGACREFEAMIAGGLGVNIYMFHGGTNFGFTSGGNSYSGGCGTDNAEYTATTTSYDYEAPLNERGEVTELCRRMAAIIRKYRPELPPFNPPVRPAKKYGTIRIDGCAPLLTHWQEFAKPIQSSHPLMMDDLGQASGYILYRTREYGPCGAEFGSCLRLWNLHDRAQVFQDGVPRGTLTYRRPAEQIPFKVEGESSLVEILVEDTSRINYGPGVGEHKKGVGEILSGGHFLMNIENIPFDLGNLEGLTFEPAAVLKELPAFYHAVLEVDTPEDTFLRFPGVRGAVLVNGFNIGRYFQEGPGDALFVPRELLKAGKNEIIVFELHQLHSATLTFTDERHWESIVPPSEN